MRSAPLVVIPMLVAATAAVIAAPLAAQSVVAPAARGTTAAAAPFRGLVYRAVRRDRDTLHLIGSVHLLDSANAALPERLVAPIRSARAVVFELDLDTATAQMPAAIRVGLAPAGQSLWSGVTPGTDSLARTLLTRLGVQPAQVAPFKPWLLAIQLAGMASQAAGLAPGLGVDRQAFTLATAARHRIVALETVREQFAIFDGLSAADQDTFLRNTVVQFDSLGAQSRQLLAAWRGGDANALDAIANGRMARYPEAKRALLDDRNRRWVPALDTLASAREGHVAVVVGAAHLTGPTGLVALLRDAGYTVDVP